MECEQKVTRDHSKDEKTFLVFDPRNILVISARAELSGVYRPQKREVSN